MELIGTEPIRTIIPRSVGVGTARVNGDLHAMLRLSDDVTGGTIDVLVDKATLGQIIAHGDKVRRQLPQEVSS